MYKWLFKPELRRKQARIRRKNGKEDVKKEV
jgi:hypothetical protein